MNLNVVFIACVAIFMPITVGAVNTFYCPVNHGTIRVGMNRDQVLSLCGQPTDIQQSKQPLMEQIPVTQLIYTNLNKSAVYSGLDSTYRMWSLPSGTTQVNLEVDIIGDQVSQVRINGDSNNAMNICNGQPVQIGDAANSVYNACGNPSMVNQTYIKRPVQGSNNSDKPEVWVYQVDRYQPVFRLTFLNGILQSIDQ